MEEDNSDRFNTGTTAPIVELAPVQDAPQTQGSTRIEGMEALESSDIDAIRESITAEELSFYSASENEHGDDNIWGLLSGVGGNIYEW